MRHAARRFSLSGTAPPFRGRKVTATPYALRPATPTPTAHPPLLVPPSNAPDPDKPPDVEPLPRTLPPRCPSHTPRPDMHIQDKPGVLLSKEKKKKTERSRISMSLVVSLLLARPSSSARSRTVRRKSRHSPVHPEFYRFS